jgi:hypothetical protein
MRGDVRRKKKKGKEENRESRKHVWRGILPPSSSILHTRYDIQHLLCDTPYSSSSSSQGKDK